MRKKGFSLRWGLMASIVLCWIAAGAVVLYIAGIFININFSRNLEQMLTNNAESALRQVEIRLSDSIESSKGVSYDGTLRSAYRGYSIDGDNTALYRTANQYVYDRFSRDVKFKAVFITFCDESVDANVYSINQKTNSYPILQQFLTEVQPKVTEIMADADTAIRFFVHNGELYMSRNLMSSQFIPYATVTMLCDTSVLLQPLMSFSSISDTTVELDGMLLTLRPDGTLEETQAPGSGTTGFSTEVDGHVFSFYVKGTQFVIWRDMPGLKKAIAIAVSLVLPILAVMIGVFYVTVSKPIKILVSASEKMVAGEQGYQITEKANTREFGKLYSQFNLMSTELKNRFEHSRLEQQALQQAKIRALQSQINPHFLNNTLEVINWEARMAGDESVSEMIDALSTMLDAALDRDGTGTTTVKHEISYVDAYLRIIHKRLGSRFVTDVRVDESLFECQVPKLLLQPIVENAVEHDITPRKGGKLSVNVRKEGNEIILDVIHDGAMNEDDMRKIEEILGSADPRNAGSKGQVGLKNVAARLKLLYGDTARLSIRQIDENTVRARIRLPYKSAGI